MQWDFCQTLRVLKFSCLTIRHCVITSFPITWILFFKEYLCSPDICLHCMFAIPRTEAHRFWSENITGQPIDYEQSPHLHQRVRKERTRRVTGRSRSISREATKVKAEGDSDEEEEECLELEKAREIKKKAANSDGSAKPQGTWRPREAVTIIGYFRVPLGLCFKTRVGDQQCK